MAIQFSSGRSSRPKDLQRAMAFVDGTNLFKCFEHYKLVLNRLNTIAIHLSDNRQLQCTYIYTSQPTLDQFKEIHGPHVLDDCRVVLGDTIPEKNDKFREKGVDALLVADLIYHGAAKNYDYAILISNDTDFRYAIKRAEDFGCRTCLGAVITEPPQRLRESCDEYKYLTREWLITN